MNSDVLRRLLWVAVILVVRGLRLCGSNHTHTFEQKKNDDVDVTVVIATG